MGNNLFDFATKELSQDAFVCWCLNWYNYPDAVLYPMAAELLELFGETETQKEERISIHRQVRRIDILVVLPAKNRAIIIEDKTNSSEHDDQIAVYRETLKAGGMESLGIGPDTEIRTVYLKTGFHFDMDKKTVADIKVNGQELLSILQKHRGLSEIADNYIEHLYRVVEEQKSGGQYIQEPFPDDCREWNISRHHIAQYNFLCDLLRERFPESMWAPDNVAYKTEQGTDSGRLFWTSFGISYCQYPGSEYDYQIFWRLESRAEPVLLLRFYDKYDKKDKAWKELHYQAYDCFRKKAEELLTSRPELQLKWDDVKQGYTGGYYETTILTIPLKDYLLHWEESASLLQQQVIAITECFLEADEILAANRE